MARLRAGCGLAVGLPVGRDRQDCDITAIYGIHVTQPAIKCLAASQLGDRGRRRPCRGEPPTPWRTAGLARTRPPDSPWGRANSPCRRTRLAVSGRRTRRAGVSDSPCPAAGLAGPGCPTRRVRPPDSPVPGCPTRRVRPPDSPGRGRPTRRARPPDSPCLGSVLLAVPLRRRDVQRGIAVEEAHRLQGGEPGGVNGRGPRAPCGEEGRRAQPRPRPEGRRSVWAVGDRQTGERKESGEAERLRYDGRPRSVIDPTTPK